MNLKNKFCRSVDPATLTPPLTKIPGSAPDADRTAFRGVVQAEQCMVRSLSDSWQGGLIKGQVVKYT